MARWNPNRVLAIVLAAGTLFVGSVAEATDWPMYGRDLQHTFTNADSLITSANAAFLQPAWTFPTGDAVSASPTMVAGIVYVGAWDGFFYALDAATGALKWKFQVDCQNSVLPVPPQCLAPGEQPPDRTTTDGGLITSSATVFDGKVYFAGGKTLYCLRTADGSLVWKRVLCGNPDVPACETDTADPTRIFSSPAIFHHRVYVGHTVDGRGGYRGGFDALDARTGKLRWRFEIDPVLDANGVPVKGPDGQIMGQNRGCGGTFSSAAIDTRKRLLYFGTSDCDFGAPPPYHEAIIALRTGTGRVRWVFRPRQQDTCDFDFGASPNLIDIAGNRWVGAGGKDGTYYVLDGISRDPAGTLVWSVNVVFGGSSGGFIGSSAFDGQRVVGGTAFGELGGSICDPSNPRDTFIQQPTMHAFDPLAKTVLWEDDGAATFGPSSVGNGVVFVGSLLPPALRAFATDGGRLLSTIAMPGAVNSGTALVDDMLVVGSGNSNDGAGSAVRAFKLP